jgi:hypothetical protein
MKTVVTLVLLLVLASSASAVFLSPFTSWEELTENSPDIVIARCSKTTPDAIPIHDGMIWSDIEAVKVIKGDTKPGVARMVSQYWPRQGERFLMFSEYQSNDLYSAYNATETYRIVPLGRYFNTNKMDGKSLDEQIQLVLQHRLEEVSRELKEIADEKKRLEEAIKN